MKKNLTLLFFSILTILALASCQKDENIQTTDGKDVSEVVLKSFENKYPEAQNVIWEKKSPYWVAHFDLPKTKAVSDSRANSSWFDNQGRWQMSEKEISYHMLPQAVRTSFEASRYAKWEKDDILSLEREGVIGLYMIEVEKERPGEDLEMELYYTADGILTREIESTDDHTDLIPEGLPEGLAAILEKEYPGFQLLECEMEDKEIEVGILFQNKDYELVYTADFRWISTEWEISPADIQKEVPEKVMEVLIAKVGNLSSFHMDEVEVTRNAEGTFYEFELEDKKDDDHEIELVINEKGQVVFEKEDQ